VTGGGGLAIGSFLACADLLTQLSELGVSVHL
jgi:hypothetical protein